MFLGKLEPGEAGRHGGLAHESHQLTSSPSWIFSYASTFIETSNAMLLQCRKDVMNWQERTVYLAYGTVSGLEIKNVHRDH